MDHGALDIPRLRGVTHAYAFWLALVAAAALIALTPAGAPRVAAAIYGAGLCAVFGGSGLYHRWRWHPRWRPLLRRVDHSTIYVFIAACYTPVGMLVLSGATRWVVLITVWAGALLGVALQRRLDQRAARAVRRDLRRARLGRGDRLPAAAEPSCRSAPLVLIAAGGVLYTIGAIVFALGRPDPWPRVFGFHEIFHVFVILAAIAHFVAMAGWIVPSGLDG